MYQLVILDLLELVHVVGVVDTDRPKQQAKQEHADDLQYRAREERPQQLQDQGLCAED
jgi:hypothetical protein